MNKSSRVDNPHAGCDYEVDQQQEGPDVYHPSHELFPTTTSNPSTEGDQRQKCSSKSNLGFGIWLPCCGQSKVMLVLLHALISTLTFCRYVHANYRFIVDPRRDYHPQSVDADVYLDWNLILQVLVSPLSQPAACPICLGDPIAPRMAKCGHIFCLHCLIRYMHSTDDVTGHPEKRPRWKTCPLCWNVIYISETRPVRWYVGQEQSAPREGGDVVLRLVKRSAGSTLALPKDSSSALGRDEDIPWHFAADVLDYARVMKGTTDYMLDQYDQEIVQLEETERHDELMFGEDSEWTGKAIRAVRDLKERLRGIGNGPTTSRHSNTLDESMSRNEEPSSGQDAEHEHESDSVIPENWTDQVDDPQSAPNQLQGHSSSSGKWSESALSRSLAQLRAVEHTPAASDYYFYQSLLHYYLSPLDIRILRTAFGDYSTFPSTILPRVERVTMGHVIDDDLRKRAKYLAHLPYGCEVSFVECDWTDTVPAEILENFKTEIQRRRKRNHEKDTREEKDRMKAEREEDEKRYAALRRKRPTSIEGNFRPEDFQPLIGSDGTEVGGEEGESGMGSTSPMMVPRKPNGSAFASLASPSTSPSEHRTVWGTTAVAPASPVMRAGPAPEPEPQDDGWRQGWEDELFGEKDLATELEASTLEGESSQGASSGKSKKKKGKKITLMSTNARRGA